MKDSFYSLGDITSDENMRYPQRFHINSLTSISSEISTQTESSFVTVATSGKTYTKKKKRRHIPHRERPGHLVELRNTRERQRTSSLSGAFEKLQQVIPSLNKRTTRVAKVKILQHAIQYIDRLRGMTDGDGPLIASLSSSSSSSSSPALSSMENDEPVSSSYECLVSAGTGWPMGAQSRTGHRDYTALLGHSGHLDHSGHLGSSGDVYGESSLDSFSDQSNSSAYSALCAATESVDVAPCWSHQNAEAQDINRHLGSYSFDFLQLTSDVESLLDYTYTNNIPLATGSYR